MKLIAITFGITLVVAFASATVIAHTSEEHKAEEISLLVQPPLNIGNYHF